MTDLDDTEVLARYARRMAGIENLVKDRPPRSTRLVAPEPRVGPGRAVAGPWALAASLVGIAAVLIGVIGVAQLAGRGERQPGTEPSAGASATSTGTAAATLGAFGSAGVSGVGSGALICGRLDPATCAHVAELVRAFAPDVFTPRTTIVADYSCPPGARCRADFAATVIAVQPGSPWIVDLPAFFVLGTCAPEHVYRETYAGAPDHLWSLVPVPFMTR